MFNLNKKVMQFSKLEMSAIVKMAKVMALADGVVEKSELDMIANELRRFGVPASDLKTIFEIGDSMQATEAASVISKMDAEHKRYVTAYLGVMIAIDGDIDDKEVAMWSLISSMCNLPKMGIKEAFDIMDNI